MNADTWAAYSIVQADLFEGGGGGGIGPFKSTESVSRELTSILRIHSLMSIFHPQITSCQREGGGACLHDEQYGKMYGKKIA